MSNKPVSLSETPPSMSENSAVAILQALIILLVVFTVLDLNAAQKQAFLDKRDGPTPTVSLCQEPKPIQHLRRFIQK